MEKRRPLLLGLIFGVLLGGILGFGIARQNELLKAQTQYQAKSIEQHSALIESVQKSSLVFLMGNILDKVDEELTNHPTSTLSDETIARIAALNNAFQPYVYGVGDSLSATKLSPERGQLLLALSIMNMDSSSFETIKAKTSFAGADLSGADLNGANLRGVDLRGANLQEADLRGANLNQADLRKANLWGANLRIANLAGADLKRAHLSWADLTGADLAGADLNGTDLTNAKLRKSDMQRVLLQWADVSGAFFNEANLSGADFLATEASRVNLSGANLSGTVLTRFNLNEANLMGVELLHASFDEEDWLERLTKWQVTGANLIQKKYKMVRDTIGPYKYRLEKAEEIHLN